MIIKRKYYTDYEELDQKEFGIVSDLYHSTPKKVYKKYAGRARSKVAKGIEGIIDKNNEKYTDALDNFRESLSGSGDTLSSPELMKKLIRNNREKTGARVFKMDFGAGPFTSTSEDTRQRSLALIDAGNNIKDNIIKREGKKLLNSSNKDRAQIYLPDKSGAEYLAHEIGHNLNRTGNAGPLRKLINIIASSEKVGGDFVLNTKIDANELRKRDVIKESLKRYTNSKLIRSEEKAASRNALKELKKAGATKEELEIAKKNLDNAYKTYKHKSREYYLDPLYQKIQLPKRRRSDSSVTII